MQHREQRMECFALQLRTLSCHAGHEFKGTFLVSGRTETKTYGKAADTSAFQTFTGLKA